MCGIFAYLNYLTAVDRQTIADILTNGLKRLEYRGYDSAGKIFCFSFPLPSHTILLNKTKKNQGVYVRLSLSDFPTRSELLGMC